MPATSMRNASTVSSDTANRMAPDAVVVTAGISFAPASAAVNCSWTGIVGNDTLSQRSMPTAARATSHLHTWCARMIPPSRTRDCGWTSVGWRYTETGHRRPQETFRAGCCVAATLNKSKREPQLRLPFPSRRGEKKLHRLNLAPDVPVGVRPGVDVHVRGSVAHQRKQRIEPRAWCGPVAQGDTGELTRLELIRVDRAGIRQPA